MSNKVISMMHSIVDRYAYKKYYRKTQKMYQEKLKKVESLKPLTSEQKKEILNFYKRITGKKISLIYHEYFYSRTGKYSMQYMPVDLYEADIIGRANRLDIDRVFSDKNMSETLLPMIRQPKSILKNINGYYYYENRPVNKIEAVRLCQNIDTAIIKPSQLSWGRGVQRISVKEGVTAEGESLVQLFEKYKKNFLIQECVTQHERMSALNPTSINTIRIMTYRSGMDILVVYTAVRIGRNGQVTDNQSKGGISTIINEDGTLGKYGFGAVGDDLLEKTDTGVVLEGYQVPFYKEAIEMVRQAHYYLPFYDIVGWDMAITPDGPIMIEWNSRPGPSQTACGTGLGKYTERIITEVLSRNNSRRFS